MELDTIILGNALRAWLTALGIALAINVAVALLKYVITQRLARRIAQQSSDLNDSVIEAARRTRQTLIFMVTLYVGCRYLNLPDRADALLQGAATIGAFVQLGLWLGALLDFWINRSRRRALQQDAGAATSLAALSFVGRTLLWAIILLLTLDNLGINVTALVAGLGVGGIAVALAVQNILGDLFASLSIVIDKPFVIGDFIAVDALSGTVEHVGLKTTRLRSLSGEQLIISNSDLLKARLRNFKRMSERRVLLQFGVTYQTAPELLEWIPGEIQRIVRQHQAARFERAHFIKFGDSSLDFEAVYWITNADYALYMDLQQAINLALLRSLNERKVDFAYPTQTLVLDGPIQLSGR